MNYWTQSERNIFVAAHRGWSSAYPENTMLAFRRALDLNVDQLETDVRCTKDGELVLMHDKDVDRTTDGSGLVKDMTLAEIKALDAGVKKGEAFRGERVPTLREWLELIKDHPTLTIDVELKEYPTEGQEDWAYDVCDRTLAMVDAYGYADRCVINTFSGKLQEYIHRKYGDKYKLHVYYPAFHNRDLSEDTYEYGYCVCMFGNNREFIAERADFDRMKATYGIQTWAGAGVRDEETVDMAIDRGAQLITCNNPDLILDLLRKKGYHA